jgi:hypothetical protein
MKKLFLLVSLVFILSFQLLNLEVLGYQDKEDSTIGYNPKDYDPWIPLEWIKEDWTFWE